LEGKPGWDMTIHFFWTKPSLFGKVDMAAQFFVWYDWMWLHSFLFGWMADLEKLDIITMVRFTIRE
jgi:hypothetical protein